jgi:N-acetylglucosamine kinase-like BadF-type ATPase
VESSTGRALVIDAGGSDTRMGLTPSGTSVVLVSLAHAAMR